jgi:hypothetical protein
VLLAAFDFRLLAVGCRVLVFYFLLSDVPFGDSCSLLVVGCRLSSDDCGLYGVAVGGCRLSLHGCRLSFVRLLVVFFIGVN